MSTKKLPINLTFLILTVFLVSIIIGGFRQLIVNYFTNIKITQKQKELKNLEEKNLALKTRLAEVQSLEFVDEQARKLLQLGDPGRSLGTKPSGSEPITIEKKKEEIANWRKWQRLFGF